MENFNTFNKLTNQILEGAKEDYSRLTTEQLVALYQKSDCSYEKDVLFSLVYKRVNKAAIQTALKYTNQLDEELLHSNTLETLLRIMNKYDGTKSKFITIFMYSLMNDFNCNIRKNKQGSRKPLCDKSCLVDDETRDLIFSTTPDENADRFSELFADVRSSLKKFYNEAIIKFNKQSDELKRSMKIKELNNLHNDAEIIIDSIEQDGHKMTVKDYASLLSGNADDESIKRVLNAWKFIKKVKQDEEFTQSYGL